MGSVIGCVYPVRTGNTKSDRTANRALFTSPVDWGQRYKFLYDNMDVRLFLLFSCLILYLNKIKIFTCENSYRGIVTGFPIACFPRAGRNCLSLVKGNSEAVLSAIHILHNPQEQRQSLLQLLLCFICSMPFLEALYTKLGT